MTTVETDPDTYLVIGIRDDAVTAADLMSWLSKLIGDRDPAEVDTGDAFLYEA